MLNLATNTPESKDYQMIISLDTRIRVNYTLSLDCAHCKMGKVPTYTKKIRAPRTSSYSLILLILIRLCGKQQYC